MSTPTPPEQPREPMPDSFRPFWIFCGWMVLVVIAMGLVAAIIDVMVRR